MTTKARQAFIARYKAGYRTVVAALRGIRPAELDWRPAPGEWSAREVVHHLADSETVSGIRFRRLLAEETPLIQGYDQAAARGAGRAGGAARRRPTRRGSARDARTGRRGERRLGPV